MLTSPGHVEVDESIDRVAVQPIETKLFHYLPGTSVLTVGSWGCGTRCGFCRNADVALRRTPVAESSQREDLIGACLTQRLPTLGFSWNEPILRAEMLARTMARARGAGLRTVVVSSGWATEESIELLAPVSSAWRIDLKASGAESATRVFGTAAPWGSSFRAAARLHRLGVHVELSLTYSPGLHPRDEMRRVAAFVASRVSPDTAVHIQALLPAHRLRDLPVADPSTVTELLDAMRAEGLRHVYDEHPLGGDEGRVSRCSCGADLVERCLTGVRVHLTADGSCPACRRRCTWIETVAPRAQYPDAARVHLA